MGQVKLAKLGDFQRGIAGKGKKMLVCQVLGEFFLAVLRLGQI
jgi:hypothetical protein